MICLEPQKKASWFSKSIKFFKRLHARNQWYKEISHQCRDGWILFFLIKLKTKNQFVSLLRSFIICSFLRWFNAITGTCSQFLWVSKLDGQLVKIYFRILGKVKMFRQTILERWNIARVTAETVGSLPEILLSFNLSSIKHADEAPFSSWGISEHFL